jgi:hypothetical protein
MRRDDVLVTIFLGETLGGIVTLDSAVKKGSKTNTG